MVKKHILIMCSFVTALVLDSGSVGAEATDFMNSANGIMDGCRNLLSKTYSGANRAFEVGYCLGLVNAISRVGPGVCIPKEVINNQSVRVVVQYIDSQPVRLNEDFRDLAVEALRKAWPCKPRDQ